MEHSTDPFFLLMGRISYLLLICSLSRQDTENQVKAFFFCYQFVFLLNMFLSSIYLSHKDTLTLQVV